jgi:exosome complex component CSL4
VYFFGLFNEFLTISISSRKDVRATEKDKVEINKSFRCGDIVIARVISLGDTNSYFLSCAENELGVVIAYSEAGITIKFNIVYLFKFSLFTSKKKGHRMVPISWNEMQCQLTMLKEHRKVAKVQPDFINYVELKDKKEESGEKGMDVEIEEITAKF